MTKAEMLLERSRLLDRIGTLGTRLAENAILQENGHPAQLSDAMLEELGGAFKELEALTRRI